MISVQEYLNYVYLIQINLCIILKNKSKLRCTKIIDSGTNHQNHLNTLLEEEQNRLQYLTTQILQLRHIYRSYTKFLGYPET